ncbi:MAG: hypothetical protein AMXMBFR23_14390 [Chloroflexota bacterium]
MTTEGMVLNSLADLAAVRDRFVVDGRVPKELALVPVIDGRDPDAIGSLVADAQAALAEFAGVIEADRARRGEAEAGLSRWRHLRDELHRVGRIAAQTHEAAARADELARHGFAAGDRHQARSVAEHMGRLATRAEAHAAVLRREADALAERDDISRLLAEERNQEQEMEMRETLTLAREHLDHDRHEEARRLLTSLGKSISSQPDLQGTFETLRNRAEAVKVQVAEDALREGRRLHRREPVAALDLLERIDLEGLPEELARHLYGLWLTACRRIGLLAAVHYRTGFGRGAVLMPTADGQYEVVSAIGLRRWQRGRRFAPQALRGARPLA